MDGVPLDSLVARLLARSPFEYRLAVDDADRELAYRLRAHVVVAHGWRDAGDLPGGLERDEYDDRALHVLGWDGDVPMSTGRVVLPPGLPTEGGLRDDVALGHAADVYDRLPQYRAKFCHTVHGARPLTEPSHRFRR